MPRVVMRLYVAGDAPNSVAARANLDRLLAEVRPPDYSLDVVDCLHEPLRTLQDGVLLTPTLLRLEPEPVRTIIGTLGDRRAVAEALGFASGEDTSQARTSADGSR